MSWSLKCDNSLSLTKFLRILTSAFRECWNVDANWTLTVQCWDPWTIHRSSICVVIQYRCTTVYLWSWLNTFPQCWERRERNKWTLEVISQVQDSRQWQCSTIANAKRKYRADTPFMIIANMHTLSHTNMERGCRSLSLKRMRVVSAHHVHKLSCSKKGGYATCVDARNRKKL